MRFSDLHARYRARARAAGSSVRGPVRPWSVTTGRVRMSRLRLAPLAVAALALAVVPLAGATSTANAERGTVTMSGTAYEFDHVETTLPGATIHVLEDPDLTTTVADDGTYTLEVPDGAEVTPYITADGHGTIYLQTFTTAGQDLVNVNFQTPTARDDEPARAGARRRDERRGLPGAVRGRLDREHQAGARCDLPAVHRLGRPRRRRGDRVDHPEGRDADLLQLLRDPGQVRDRDLRRRWRGVGPPAGRQVHALGRRAPAPTGPTCT